MPRAGKSRNGKFRYGFLRRAALGDMKRRTWSILGAAFLALAAAAPGPEPDGLYLFFAPDSPGLERLAAGLAGHPVRPVLLAEDLRAELPDSFLEAVRRLGREFPVIDVEGLEAARRFGVRRLPCLVAVRNGKVHVASGSGLPLQEVLECSR